MTNDQASTTIQRGNAGPPLTFLPLPAGEGQGEREADVDRTEALESLGAGAIPHSPLPTPHFESLEAAIVYAIRGYPSRSTIFFPGIPLEPPLAGINANMLRSFTNAPLAGGIIIIR